MRHNIRIFAIFMFLLVAGSVINSAWAYKVTYHILTLPIDNSIYHMNDVFSGKRLEAVRVVDNNATKFRVPAQYLSPLGKNYRLYLASYVERSEEAVAMYDYSTKNKCYHYNISTPADSLTWGSDVTANIDVYVTYEYDADNTIADLSGSRMYNLTMSNGFYGFNRGRNNRMAVFQKSLNLVKAEDLVSEDFVQYPYTNDNKVAGTNIGSYWQSNDNKNTKGYVAGQFHFMFKFEGSDPYNILIGTTYDRDYAYIEKHGVENSYRYKWYKGGHLFRPSDEKSGFFMASDDHKEYTKSGTTYDPNPDSTIPSTNMSGYFKSKGTSLTYSTFAMLNNSAKNGYVFMVSKFINDSGDINTPGDYKNASYNYLIRDNDYNNLTYGSKTLSGASDFSTDPKIYLVREYVFKVKLHTTGEVISKVGYASEYSTGIDPKDFVPNDLKRKYVTFTGAYKEDGFTNKYNTFEEIDADGTAETVTEGGITRKVIWLKYETDMPFETSDPGTTYDDLKWYNISVNKDSRYSAYWDGTMIKTTRDLSKYARASHVAFIGDPFDLKIVGRKSSEDGSGNPSTLNYMKLADPIDGNAGFDASGTTWGIVYDDDTGDYKDCFRLKDSSGNYLHQNTITGNPLNGTTDLSAAVRITVNNLPNKNYIYYIMRRDGSIAVMSQGWHEPSAKLSFKHIPTSISSPFIKDVPLQFYGGYTSNQGGEGKAIEDAEAETPTITYSPDIETGDIQYIVVRYTFNETTSLTNYSKINGTSTATFNVRLNGQYIYYDKNEEVEANRIKSSAEIEEGTEKEYNWTLGGGDPYTMTIKPQTVDYYIAIPEKSPGVIDWPTGDEEGVGTAVTWTDTAPSSKYIIKSSDEEGTYEVMGATGLDYEAMEESFNFGRPDANTVRIYSDWKYISGSDVLRFELIAIEARTVTYRLVDIKNNNVLLSVDTRQPSTDAPSFPPEYRSPLVQTYSYWSSLTDAQNKSGIPRSTVGASGDIWVTYTANNLVDMTGKTTYLMKYALGDQFRQEDGSDGLLPEIPSIPEDDPQKKEKEDAKKYRYQAVYPYCNGDCNFFVYGQEQYDIQQQGAASTRTRWAWYVESVSGDPYHVKISSRQDETYPVGSKNDYNAYFRTFSATYDGANHIVTTLAWPGISGEQGTEYMVLGSAGQFRLLTSDAISDGTTTERRAVNSFEQYWKTWNTIRKVVLGDSDAEARQSDPTTVPAEKNTPVAIEADKDNRTYLKEDMDWHSYENWAYAIRWNDYNVNGDKNKKGWEKIEHWYQTVNMGEGYFDFVPTVIEPVLILLDQHGWEVMRKPLPTSPDDPNKAAKYNAIRPYDSPMVKEYYFWTKTAKRMGYHQYHTLDQQITVDGEPFTSTSLTSLPPFDATNVHDAKGNLLDQYVTYTVKDEYVKACNVTYTYEENVVDPADANKKYTKVIPHYEGVPFLIQQGEHFVSATNETTLKNDNILPASGGMSEYIIKNAVKLTPTGDKKNELWYLMPNQNIDQEMGYDATSNPAHSWASDYDRKEKYKEEGFNSWSFDPYNIQISSVPHSTSYFVTNATKAEIHDGSLLGDGTTNTLGAQEAVETSLVGGMDNRTLKMTNATFMAVQDAAGNMQLMPRFDQEKRLKDFTELVYTNDAEPAKTHTKLYRPLVYTYKIIDNTGYESMRYQSGGDLLAWTPEWFKSPFAKDFKYYAGIEGSTGVNEITKSLASATLTDNTVYVRYSYDAEADETGILKGKWLTMSIGGSYKQYKDGYVKKTGGDSKDASLAKWQWKFLRTPFTDPDPYAIQIFNKSQVDIPISADSGNEWKLTAADGTYQYFALLPHNLGEGYALALAREHTNYRFTNGNGDEAKQDSYDSKFTSTYSNLDEKTVVLFTNDVPNTYTYKVYTNDDPVTPVHEGKYGVFAVSAKQDNSTASINDYVPTLPEEIKSPLLSIDQFKYYGAEEDMGNPEKELKNLFGLYDDIVYVRYTDYDPHETEYKVPNVKTTVDGKVARGEDSNDAALDIKGELIYNIIWYNDNIMMEDEGGLIYDTNHELDGAESFVWQFEGNDPYAIKIKHKESGKYVVGDDDLAPSATSTFMLLPYTYDADWQYGVLQVTGNSESQKLTDFGETLTVNASVDPTKFIIFGLSTHTVIYHLLIDNIGNTMTIPYREKKGDTETTKDIDGSSHRDLTTTTTVTGDTYQLGETINGINYCVNEGHITLGDSLKVPEALKRPNCKYFYYVEGIYTDDDCARPGHVDTELDAKYRGLQITEMGKEPELLGKTVRINVEYQFDDGLPTNNGSDFVTNTNGTQWYTFETNDETPYLANYTYKDAKLMAVEGRIAHYTNEYLWSPVGDPYGFKMYNRYVYKNGTEAGHADKVMTTELEPDADADLIMAVDASHDRPVYELLPGETAGFFKVQNLTIPGSGTPYYIDNNAGKLKLKESTSTEWTFGLSDALLDPYYLGAGNVGGLTTTAKAGQDKSGVERYEAATNLIEKQEVVFNDVNIVDFTPGYYRIFNQPNSQGVKTPRYLSGYLHKTELTENIPMHFYEKEGETTNFETLGGGYTTTPATQGQIPIIAPEYDPASIFYITGTDPEEPSTAPYTMQTQGLYVDGAVMASAPGTNSNFYVVDIGGAVVLLHNGAEAAERKYLHYKQTGNIYDVKYQVVSEFNDDDAAKWCMEPANKKGLYIETHSGGEEEVLTDLWYYSSYCVPFDMMIQYKEDKEEGETQAGLHSSNAYTCVEAESPWNEKMLHPKPIGKYTTAAGASYPDELRWKDYPTNTKPNDYFVPAGTPVLFSTRLATEYIKATIPTNAPSTPITTIFSARYLEQQLPWDPANSDKLVYVFGPKMTGDAFTLDTTTGNVIAEKASLGNTNVGFHRNANQNKESAFGRTSWIRNNYYVLHNRIFYIDGSPNNVQSKAPDFVPVIFDFNEDLEEEEMTVKPRTTTPGDDKVYDLHGRCIATGDEVLDGSWKNNVAPGLYIIGGKKMYVGQ